jgi:hypothetical protein
MMAAMRLLAVALILTPAVATRASADMSPLNKVLGMMADMMTKGKAEKHEEEVEFAKYQAWCDDTRFNTQKAIEEAAAQIEQLTADIAKAEADAEELAGEIEELEGLIAANEKEAAEATAIRDKEHADFMAVKTDLSESIDAVERAIKVLKNKEKDVPQSLLQVQNSERIPYQAKAAIEAFLALAEHSEDGAPEANAYENQSGGIISILEKLRLKFQDEKLAAEKEESNSKSAYQTLFQKLTDTITRDKSTVKKKTTTKAERLETAATAKGDLKVTTEGKAEDEKKLSDTNAKCQSQSEEFENNQVLRSEEIKVIEQAVKILSADEVSGTADKHLPSLAQEGDATALVQLRGGDDALTHMLRQKVVDLLQAGAKKTGSKFLTVIATHAAADPFGKVKKMIKDLIVKLMEEANAEADHKGFCDTEMATNKQTRDIKSSEVEELSGTIDKNTAQSGELTVQLKELADAISELRKEQSTATEIRGEEKTTNTKTIEEAKVAQVAVEKATQVLKDFYAKASEASLLQDGGEMSMSLKQEMKQATKAPYKGMGAESGGIIGFLEVVLSDFARLEAETSSAEDSAQEAYSKFMDESNEDIAVKDAEVEHKTSSKETLDTETAALKKELDLTQEELDAAMDYYEKLKPDCVDQGLSYEDRVKAREAEIQSLQEALEILGQQDLA